MYNSDLEDGVIHKIEVYEQKAEGQMCAKMEYRYNYDEQGRLTSREIARWDDSQKTWVNDFRHTYRYYKHGYNVETKTFKMNEAKNDMYLINSLLCMEPLEMISDRLLALK